MKSNLIFFVAVISCQQLIAQSSGEADTAFVPQAVASAVKVYDKFIHGQELYYNGSAYIEPPRTGEQHSFFLNEDWIFGDLFFDGDYYTNIPLQYDIMIDQLIGESATGNMQVMPREKVKFFILQGKRFEYIDNKKVNNTLPRSGFYQVLYDGSTRVVAQRQKDYQEQIESGELEVYFVEKSRYFILKDGGYMPVNTKTSLLTVLKDQRSQLRSFIRKNKLSHKDRDKMMTAVAKQYDLLISQLK